MSTILEALAVIKAKDQTGGALDSVTHKINRMSRAWAALSKDVEKHVGLAQRAEMQASKLARAGQAIHTGAGMARAAGAAVAGSGIARTVGRHLVKDGGDREHEVVRMRTAGMTEKEIAEAEDLARSTSTKYKSLSTTEIMHTARNIRSVVGTFEEATKIIDPLMKLRVVAQGAHPERTAELGEDFDKLVKGLEIKGVTQDHHKFEHYIDGMAKAVNVFGDTLRPTDYYEMFKYGRAATNALSDDFMLKTAPTLAQELGGAQAGTALSSFHTQFVGGKMSNKSVEMLDRLGLIDPKKVIKTTTGSVKGVMPGGVVSGGYLTPGNEDPYAWVNKVLLPAIDKKGLSPQQREEYLKGISEGVIPKGANEQEVIAAAASRSTTAQMLSIFATQQARIEKDWKLVEGAHGISAADEFLKSDPKMAQIAMQRQFENYSAETGKTIMPALTGGMNWLATTLNQMSEFARDKPSQNASWLATGTGGATALGADLGAAFLSRWGLGSGGFQVVKTLGKLAPIISLAQIGSDVVSDDDIKRLKAYEASPRARFDQLRDLDDKEKAASIYGDRDFEADVKAQVAAKRAAIEKELTDFGYGPAGTPGRGLMAGSYTTEDIQRALGIGGNKEPVKAVVEGEATLKVEVTTSPSADFLSRISATVQNGINAFKNTGGGATGSTGSTGRSMPEAGPPQ